MQKTLQWEIEVVINAPVARVWQVVDDLTLIPEYHPEVETVEFVSGHTQRAAGVDYKCVIPKKHFWCVERVVEYVPQEKMSITFPDDSLGMHKKFDHFVTDVSVESMGPNGTRVRLSAYYEPKGFILKWVNGLLLRRIMRKKALRTLEGLKRFIEE